MNRLPTDRLRDGKFIADSPNGHVVKCRDLDALSRQEATPTETVRFGIHLIYR